jgi:hypothetical protein
MFVLLVLSTIALALVAGAVAVSRADLTPTSPASTRPSNVRLWFTDANEHRIQQASPGQVIRIHSSWGRVCVRRTDGDYCASPRRPSVLQRVVRPNLILGGRVRAYVSDFSVLVTRASIPVRVGG